METGYLQPNETKSLFLRIGRLKGLCELCRHFEHRGITLFGAKVTETGVDRSEAKTLPASVSQQIRWTQPASRGMMGKLVFI